MDRKNLFIRFFYLDNKRDILFGKIKSMKTILQEDVPMDNNTRNLLGLTDKNFVFEENWLKK